MDISFVIVVLGDCLVLVFVCLFLVLPVLFGSILGLKIYNLWFLALQAVSGVGSLSCHES